MNQKKIVLIKAQAKEKSDSPKLLFIRSGASISSFKAKTSEENFTAKMLTELGAENIALFQQHAQTAVSLVCTEAGIIANNSAHLS